MADTVDTSTTKKGYKYAGGSFAIWLLAGSALGPFGFILLAAGLYNIGDSALHNKEVSDIRDAERAHKEAMQQAELNAANAKVNAALGEEARKQNEETRKQNEEFRRQVNDCKQDIEKAKNADKQKVISEVENDLRIAKNILNNNLSEFNALNNEDKIRVAGMALEMLINEANIVRDYGSKGSGLNTVIVDGHNTNGRDVANHVNAPVLLNIATINPTVNADAAAAELAARGFELNRAKNAFAQVCAGQPVPPGPSPLNGQMQQAIDAKHEANKNVHVRNREQQALNQFAANHTKIANNAKGLQVSIV